MKIQLFSRMYGTHSFHAGRNSVSRKSTYRRQHYFRVLADNGEIILQSEAYNSKAARNATVKLIMRTDWSKVEVQDVGEAEL